MRQPKAGISTIAICEAINTHYKIIDVEVENWRSPNRSNIPLAYGGIAIYVRCENLEEAFNISQHLEIAGHEVKIWHQGLKKCEKCGGMGHKESEHEKVTKRMEQVKKQRRLARKRQKHKE